MSRIDQVGDAAIAVLADEGTRGLTHRAVDAAGHLPPGTTSNYARTRAALLAITLRRVAELDAAEGAVQAGAAAEAVSAARTATTAATAATAAAPPLTVSALAGLLAGMLHRMISDPATRQRLLARFELALEATRRPELRAAYDELGGAFRGQVARLLALAGTAAPDRHAWTLTAWLEGTAFYALAGAGAGAGAGVGAGGGAAPAPAELRAQVSLLLASMCADESGTA